MGIARIARGGRSVLLYGMCATVAAMAAIPCVVVRPATVFAQVSDLGGEGPLEYISRGDPRVIRTQVETAIKAAEMAIEALGQGTDSEADLDRAKALALKSYLLLRYAQHGVGILAEHVEGRMASEKLLARMALTSVNEARERVLAGRTAMEHASKIPGTENQELVEEAINSLTDSIPIARRAAMLLLR